MERVREKRGKKGREESIRRREVTGEGKELLAIDKFPSREGRRERKEEERENRRRGK